MSIHNRTFPTVPYCHQVLFHCINLCVNRWIMLRFIKKLRGLELYQDNIWSNKLPVHCETQKSLLLTHIVYFLHWSTFSFIQSWDKVSCFVEKWRQRRIFHNHSCGITFYFCASILLKAQANIFHATTPQRLQRMLNEHDYNSLECSSRYF